MRRLSPTKRHHKLLSKASEALICMSLAGMGPHALASDDFDCYSDDQRIWVSGKIAEDAAGLSYFPDKLTLTLDGSVVDMFLPTHQVAHQELLDFSHAGQNYRIELSWSKKVLAFDFQPPAGSSIEKYHYLGSLTCI